MKSLPEFNEAEAIEEVRDFFKQMHAETGMRDKPYEEFEDKNKGWFNESVRAKRHDWPREWERRQLALGRKLLQEWQTTLSQDDRFLVDDYLYDQLNEARAEVYETQAGASI